MYVECRHVYPSGRKCKESHISGSDFCYRHRNIRERMYAPPPRPGTPFRLPSLEDADGCLMAVQEVAWAMGDKRITQKEAGTYLYAINIAKSLHPRRRAVTRKPVRSLCYDNDGIEMAEAVNACEPPQDCLTCQKHCHWFDYYEDEIEELEEQMAEEQEKKRLEALGLRPEEIAAQLQPPKGKYDDMLPNVRAIYEDIDRQAEENQRKLAQQQQPNLKPDQALAS